MSNYSTSAADSAENTFFAIELSDDGVLTEHVRVTSDGNVGFGTTAPNDFKIQVDGDVGPEVDDFYDWGSIWPS